ncbi:MAG TPA: hypothetical protein VND65_11850, partial [Candidatus Binatia bacterium]|nr:hypothetical protein [Candidatus Binatia bacterium]
LFLLVWQGRLELWKAAALGLIGVASVVIIGRAAGDYGIQMLYYRNFIGMPIAPAEMTAHFTVAQYAHFFVSGYKDMLLSFVPLFAMLGLVGLNRTTAPLLGVAAAYAVLHYVILPNWIDRFMAFFYLATAMSAVLRSQSFRLLESPD